MRKRLFSYLLAAALLLTLVPVGARAADCLYGDVNGDGRINAKDATMILRYSVGKVNDLSKFDMVAADVNADGGVNAKDATMILRYSVKKLDKFPADTHEHSYEAVVTQPTCTEDGYTTYSCSCGDSYTDDETAALGHDWGEWEVTNEPTIEAEGVETRTCQRKGCGKTETSVIEKLPEEETCCTSHEYEWVCDSSWEFDTGTCKNCGETKVIYASSSTISYDVLDAINAYRRDEGLSELAWAGGAETKLRMRAAELQIQFDHLRLDGTQTGRSECCTGASNAQMAVDHWYNSSSHNGTIMRADAKYATAAYNGTCWIVWIMG